MAVEWVGSTLAAVRIMFFNTYLNNAFFVSITHRSISLFFHPTVLPVWQLFFPLHVFRISPLLELSLTLQPAKENSICGQGVGCSGGEEAGEAGNWSCLFCVLSVHSPGIRLKRSVSPLCWDPCRHKAHFSGRLLHCLLTWIKLVVSSELQICLGT